MLTSLHLHIKNSQVCTKTRSPPASLPFQGQVTKHTTVKWPIAFQQSLTVCGRHLNALKVGGIVPGATQQNIRRFITVQATIQEGLTLFNICPLKTTNHSLKTKNGLDMHF